MPATIYWLNHSNLVLYYEDLLKEPERSFSEIYRTIGASEVTFKDKINLPYDNPLEIVNNPEMIHLFLMSFPYKDKLPNNLEII